MTGESEQLEGADDAHGEPVEPEIDYPAEPAAATGACPYLGVVGDRYSHHSFPSRLHLCHAGEPAHIGLGFQADYCLGGLYPSCARFQRAEDAAAAQRAQQYGESVAGGVTLAAATAGAGATLPLDTVDLGPPPPPPPPVAAPSHSLGRVVSSREPTRSSPLVTLLLGLALLATLFAFAAAAGFVGLPGGGPVANVPTPTPALTNPPTTPPTTSASPSVAPTASPTPIPTPTPSPSVEPTLATGEVLHTVQTGETLSSIGLFYDVPWPDIAARNGLADPFVIVPGQVLIIPVPGSVTPAPSSSPNASATPSPAASSFVYVVQAGDTLSAIASKFNVSQQAILDANPQITDPNKIFPGDEIVIPAAP